MKQEEINPHEVLEIAPGASRGEIERAYYLARLAYGSDSLASYSLYGPGERTAILERIERAYRLLVDEAPPPEGPVPDAGPDRAATLGPEEGPPPAAPGFGEPVPGPRTAAPAPQAPSRGREAVRPLPARPRIETTEIRRPYDAHALHGVRKSRELSLEEIAAETKISLKNLRLIESGDYDQLPPTVYLRGYLTQYARCLRLSPTDVLADYLEAVGAAAGGKGGQVRHA